MMRRMAWLVVCVALGSAGAGCAGAPRSQDCMVAVRGFNDAMRWQRLPTAASFIAAAERESFLDEQEELAEELRIDDYEVTRMTPVGKNQARVQIKYTWHLDNIGEVHDTTTRQSWERHGKRWVMVEERRLRGETMPGVAEPVDDEEALSPSGGTRAERGNRPSSGDSNRHPAPSGSDEATPRTP